MRLIQKKIDELNSLDVPLSRKDDFESFWDEAVEKVNNHEFSLKTTELTDYPLDNIVIYDSIFHGLDGTPIKCWIILPENARQKPVPAISCFHGGNGNRGFPFSHLYWVNAGFAVIAMDFRQQGGQTGSNTSFKTCGQKNFITMNIEDYKSYYLYHAWTDALLSVKAIQSIPEVD
jgi:cephalosporin-C deacetylase-like acetyl esterase